MVRYEGKFLVSLGTGAREHKILTHCYSTIKLISSFCFTNIKMLYEDVKHRIEEATERGSVPMKLKEQHEGFSEWNDPTVTKWDHQSIVKVKQRKLIN